MFAFTLIAIAFLLLSLVTEYYISAVALVLLGGGLGTILPNLNAWLLSFVPSTIKGRAIGTLVFFVFMGQFFSPVITQPLITAVGISKSYLIAGILIMFVILACGLYEFQQKRWHKNELSKRLK
jgi:MFS family permease